MSKTKTVHTPEGDVTYEAVECVSCGEDVVEHEAHYVAIFKAGTAPNKRRTEADAYGRLCDFCASGPAEYPDPDDPPEERGFGIWAFPLVYAMTIMERFTNGSHDRSYFKGYGDACLGMLLYLVLLFLLVVFEAVF